MLFAVARKGNVGCAKTGWSSNETPLKTDAVVTYDGICVFRPLMRAGNQITRMEMEMKAVTRSQSGNANHHLWNNNGTWWCHFTVHWPDFTKQRVRLALDTRDPMAARQLRDSLLALFGCPVQTPIKEVM